MGTKYNYSEGTTYKSESTPITIRNIPTGDYKITASYGELIGSLLFSTTEPGTQTLTITATEPASYYSIIYDKSLASDPEACLTYAGACEGFIAMAGGSGSANEGSWAEGNGTIFDSIEVGYMNGSTWTAQTKSAVAGNSSYNCFTKIPKIYQKVTALDDNRVQLDLSLTPFDGATLHPAFVIDGVELNHKYIGRYLAYNNSSTLESKSGKTPTAFVTRANFRTYAKANGDNYGLLSYYDWDLVSKLYLLAFKNFNGQSALGYGFANSSNSATTTTGGTNSYSWMYGTTDSTTQISFLGLEDWWGNLYQWIDNYLTSSTNIYVSQTASPSDTIDDMDILCANPTTAVQGYPLTCRAGLNDFFIGADEAGSANATGMCDYQYFGSGSYVARVGGYWGVGSSAGPFGFRSDASLSASDSRIGARLTMWD